MSMQSFQRALVELTLAPRKARALRDGDANAFAGLDLTDRELARLCDVVRQPGISVHCSLSRGNRLEVIFGSFPMTCVLLGPALRGLLDELFEEHRPTNYQLAGEDAAFAQLIQRKLAIGELSIEYLDEVFAYELACAELMRRQRTRPDADAEVETIFEFEHSPEDLLPPLSQLKAPPVGLPRGRYRTVVRFADGRFDINPALAEDRLAGRPNP